MKESVGDLRSIIVRGVVKAVRDGGAMQLVDVQTSDGFLRTDIEVWQPYGLALVPPVGSMVILLACGADPGDYMALPPSHSGARLGKLTPGDVALYHFPDGARVAVRDGALIEILTPGAVQVHCQTAEVTAPGGVTVTANVAITGTVSVTGDILSTGTISDHNGSMQEMRDDYNAHHHGSSPGPSISMS